MLLRALVFALVIASQSISADAAPIRIASPRNRRQDGLDADTSVIVDPVPPTGVATSVTDAAPAQSQNQTLAVPPSGNISAISGAASLTTVPVKGALWDVDHLDMIRSAWQSGTANEDTKAAISALIARADAETAQGTTTFYSVTQQDAASALGVAAVPAGSGPNDYVSVGVYLWPCNAVPATCTKPRFYTDVLQEVSVELNNTAAGALAAEQAQAIGVTEVCDAKTGLPWVACDGDGVKNPTTFQADLGEKIVRKLWAAVTDCALAFHYTGKDKYASRAAFLLDQFFLNPATRMNPNFQFAQFWPGEVPGSPSGSVESFRFVEILDAASLLQRATPVWTAERHTELLDWFAQFYNWYKTSLVGFGARASPNNIALWYAHFLLGVAMHLDSAQADVPLIASSVQNVIVAQVSPNGNLTHEVSRSNSRAYVVYTLTAITRLSNMVKKSTGTDLWATPQVTNAVKMFTPYVNNNAPWPYPDAHSDFDWKWAAEYTRLASLAYEEPSSEDACVRTNGTQAPLYGAPTSTVHPYLSEVAARRKMQLQEK